MVPAFLQRDYKRLSYFTFVFMTFFVIAFSVILAYDCKILHHLNMGELNPAHLEKMSRNGENVKTEAEDMSRRQMNEIYDYKYWDLEQLP